ncbi:uncharacterized protein LOC101240324 isoform X2 [Hydra vulgaris]|uniref:Uncharacterized protein LOC101240324 isoform X2 n=1 Tax=Hydra vulgaris TaxID=6087 RepID=A0ABM4CWG1_HYDVU
MKKKICSLIRERELSGKSNERNFTQNLYISSIRELNLSFQEKCTSKVFYDNNLYLNDFSKCFTGCFFNNKPHTIKTGIHKLPSKTRFIDFLRYQCPTYVNLDFSSSKTSYNECMYLLSSSSVLFCYSMRSDFLNMDQKINLGLRYCFLHLDWDKINERFYVKSKHHVVNHQNNTHFYFALFDINPFKFVGAFELSEDFFGKVLDASLSDGILYVSLKNVVVMYDLENILYEFQNQKLDNISNLQECLTINIDISCYPKVLKKINCSTFNSLSFGGFPWAYVIYEKNQVKVLRLDDEKLGAAFENIQGVLIDQPAYFHMDNSGYIMHVQSETINFYKIEDSDEFKLKTSFVIQVTSSNKMSIHPPMSKYGRVSKPVIDSSYTTLQSEVIHALDYCHDANILAILYTKTVDLCSDTYVIGLFDNSTGLLLKEYPLNVVNVSDDHEWIIYLNGMNIICLLSSIVSRYNKCFIFQLQQNII